jgi:CHASE2 domain-containing sensor protein
MRPENKVILVIALTAVIVAVGIVILSLGIIKNTTLIPIIAVALYVIVIGIIAYIVISYFGPEIKKAMKAA